MELKINNNNNILQNTNNPTLEGVTYIKNFVEDSVKLKDFLIKNADWDSKMLARKTVSYGLPYNYGHMNYDQNVMPEIIQDLCEKIYKVHNFLPNNCLINFYQDGNATMGFHSDQTDNLVENTGVVIISLGAERILRFRKISEKNDPDKKFIDFLLENGSLTYMTIDLQATHQHAVPKLKDIKEPRLSLTFRQLKE